MTRYLLIAWAVLCVGGLFSCAGNDATDGSARDGRVTDGSSAGGEQQLPLVDSVGPGAGDQLVTSGDGSSVRDSTAARQDHGTQPPPASYGKVCTTAAQCTGQGEICVKLSSDGYDRSGSPPPQGLCLKTCTSPSTSCSSSATHLYSCMSMSTWDLGSITVCAITCYTQIGGTKSYTCPAQSYCTRSIAGVMKVCTPYSS